MKVESAPAAASIPAPRWARGALGLLLLGATGGSALDGIHTHFGATSYPSPIAWSMAWWTPLLFAGAFAVGLLRPLLDRVTGRHAPRPGMGAVVFSATLFVGAYFLTVAPLPWPVVAAILLGSFIVGFALCDRSPGGLAIAVGAAVCGPLVESTLIGRGAFLHLQPTFMHVPGWLPFLYLNAAVALTTLARRLV